MQKVLQDVLEGYSRWILGYMRVLEEIENDPAIRWELLRAKILKFSQPWK